MAFVHPLKWLFMQAIDNGWLRSPLTDEETAMIETRDVTGIGIHGTNFCLGEDYRS